MPSTTITGRAAEAAVANYLISQGFRIIETNWRTRYCEIDIVAEHHRRLYFVEVKYRSSLGQGSGLDYITAKKLRQMRFAAEMWVSNHGWRHEYGLAAVEVTGSGYEITQCLLDLEES